MESGLGVSAGRYPEWQASTAQLAVGYMSGKREKDQQKESVYVCVCTESIPEVALTLLES